MRQVALLVIAGIAVMGGIFLGMRGGGIESQVENIPQPDGEYVEIDPPRLSIPAGASGTADPGGSPDDTQNLKLYTEEDIAKLTPEEQERLRKEMEEGASDVEFTFEDTPDVVVPETPDGEPYVVGEE